MQTLNTFIQQLQIHFTNDFVFAISDYYSALFLVANFYSGNNV